MLRKKGSEGFLHALSRIARGAADPPARCDPRVIAHSERDGMAAAFYKFVNTA